MKRMTYILITFLLVGLGLWLARRHIYHWIVTTHLSAEVPDFELQDLDGDSIRLSDFEGKVLVLDFWTTYCGACKRVFPHFQEIYDEYAENPQVAFLAVNTSHGGDSVDKVRAFVGQNRYTFPFAHDSDAVLSNSLDIMYYPTIIIIDKSGKMRFRHVGFSKSLENHKALISDEIERLLGLRVSTYSTGMDFYFKVTDLLFSDFMIKSLDQLNLKFGTKPERYLACSLNLGKRVGLHCRFLKSQLDEKDEIL